MSKLEELIASIEIRIGEDVSQESRISLPIEDWRMLLAAAKVGASPEAMKAVADDLGATLTRAATTVRSTTLPAVVRLLQRAAPGLQRALNAMRFGALSGNRTDEKALQALIAFGKVGGEISPTKLGRQDNGKSVIFGESEIVEAVTDYARNRGYRLDSPHPFEPLAVALEVASDGSTIARVKTRELGADVISFKTIDQEKPAPLDFTFAGDEERLPIDDWMTAQEAHDEGYHVEDPNINTDKDDEETP